MANLLGQDIGLNYKGLINIGSTINQNISPSLQSLTDGDGNLLPLQISTTQMSVGGATGTGRLIVRGDGTNPIFRVENNSGVERFSIPNAGAITTNSDISIPANNLFISGSASFSGTGSAAALYWSGSGSNGRVGVNSGGVFIDYGGTTKTNTSGTLSLATLTSAFGAAAGSANFRPLSINYTINNSGAQTGTMTGIFLNATETALNGMTHNLMDLQVGGVSAFRVDKTGSTALNTITSNSWGVFFADSGSGFLLYRGANRFKVSAAGTMAVMGNAAIGWDTTTTSARLHVRGDGTNPIARFETSAGVERVRIASDGALSSISYSTDVQRLGFNGGTFGVNRGYIRAESNGVFTLSNAAENDFSRLNYGLATSSFPALKRSTTILQARLADDSDFTFIQGKLRTETNFTNDPAVSASGYLILYDLDGTAYKVLATAL